MPTLSADQSLALEAEITEDELSSAIALTKPHKAPGPDRFTLTNNQTLTSRLNQPLLAFFNAIK